MQMNLIFYSTANSSKITGKWYWRIERALIRLCRCTGWSGSTLFRIMHIVLIWARRQKTYLRTCVPSENSDQLAHLRSLINIFTRRILGSQGCKVSSFWRRRLWSESSLDAHVKRYAFHVETKLRLRVFKVEIKSCCRYRHYLGNWY